MSHISRLMVSSLVLLVCPSLKAIAQQPTTNQSQIEWFGGPRFWYLTDTLSLYNRTPNAATVRQDARLAMYGFSLGARFPGLPSSVFTLTALQGGGKIDSRDVSFGSTSAQNVDVANNHTRSDIELLAQTAIGNSTSYWIAGVRAELSKAKIDTTIRTYSISGASLVPTTRVEPTSQVSGQTYTVKAGLGNHVPITADGRHRLFSNIMGTAGIEFDNLDRVYTQYRVGVDTAVGYQFLVDGNASIDLRYRFLANYLMHTVSGENLTVVSHGPMAGATLKW
jgi:hypothetical protein